LIGDATSSLSVIGAEIATSSLSDQVTETLNRKLLQLELENMRLLRLVDQNAIDDVRRRLDQQTAEVDRLRAERSEADSIRLAAERELAQINDRMQQLSVQLDKLRQWKERRLSADNKAIGDNKLVDEMTAEVQLNNVRLETERGLARDEVDQLTVELEEVEEERNRWRARCEAPSGEIGESRKKLTVVELNCSKLETKCKVNLM
jgi:predicted  nucleic acid-binding Zn-ribbon protein